jgi:hypothetical protein
MSAVIDQPAHEQARTAQAIEEEWRDERPSPRDAGDKTPAPRNPSRARLVAFYAVTATVGTALSALGLSSAIWPWYAPTQPFLGMHVEAHRWHGAEFAALLAVLLGGSLLILLRRPKQRPLLAQYLIINGVVIALLFEVFVGPVALGLAVPFVLIAALYPDRTALLEPVMNLTSVCARMEHEYHTHPLSLRCQ